MTPYYEDQKSGITVYCGRCEDIIPKLGIKFDLVLTDPPFAQETHSGARTGSPDNVLVDFESITQEQLIEYMDLTRSVCDRWQVAFIDWRHMLALEQQTKIDLELVRFGVWVKEGAIPQYSGDRPATGWEAIAFLHPNGKKVWNGGGRQGVFTCRIERQERMHPTQKPISLVSELVQLFSNDGDIILDPFAGSGTTARAAKNLRRKCVCIEQNEEHCKGIVARLRQEVLL